MKTQHVEEKAVSYKGRFGPHVKPTLGTEACVFFVNGSCNQGAACRFSHSYLAPKPLCKFFLTLQVQFACFLLPIDLSHFLGSCLFNSKFVTRVAS